MQQARVVAPHWMIQVLTDSELQAMGFTSMPYTTTRLFHILSSLIPNICHSKSLQNSFLLSQCGAELYLRIWSRWIEVVQTVMIGSFGWSSRRLTLAFLVHDDLDLLAQLSCDVRRRVASAFFFPPIYMYKYMYIHIYIQSHEICIYITELCVHVRAYAHHVFEFVCVC